MTRKIFLLLLLNTLAASPILSQVSEVISRASAYRSNNDDAYSSSNAYSNNSDGGFFFLHLFTGMLSPIYHGLNNVQRSQMQYAYMENWRSSLEVSMSGGMNFLEAEFFDSQMIRGNHGLFSTQLRRMNINDVSGAFTTIDWQVLQFNIINTANMRWVLGGGVSHEDQVNQSHFEWATELSVSFYERTMMPSLSYRKSGNGYPRREFNANFQYRPFREKKSEVAFLAGYLHQMLYDIRFDFASIGISLYLK